MPTGADSGHHPRVKICADSGSQLLWCMEGEPGTVRKTRPRLRPCRGWPEACSIFWRPKAEQRDGALVGTEEREGADPELRLDEARTIGERASRTDEPAMIFGLAKGTSNTPESGQMAWLSENGIASRLATCSRVPCALRRLVLRGPQDTPLDIVADSRSSDSPRSGPREVWEDAENVTNRTVKAPPKTGQTAAPGGISRPQLALRGTSLEH